MLLNKARCWKMQSKQVCRSITLNKSFDNSCKRDSGLCQFCFPCKITCSRIRDYRNMIPQSYLTNRANLSRRKVLGYANPKYPRKIPFAYKFQPSAVKKDVGVEVGTFAKSIAHLNRLLNSRNGLVFNFLWFLVISLCTLTCAYQTYDRFSLFISRPIGTRVNLIQNSSVKFPSITLCPVPGNYLPLFNLRYENSGGAKHFCQVHQFELLNDELNISTLWDLMTFNGTLFDWVVDSRSSKYIPEHKLGLETVADQIVTKTALGSCFTYSFKNLVPFRKDDFVILFIFLLNYPYCSFFNTLFAVHNDDDIITYKIMSGFRDHLRHTRVEYGLSARHFKNLNRTDQPCDTNKVVNECELNCIEKVLTNISDCRMPFTSLSELPVCANVSDVVVNYERAMQLALDFDYLLKCNCPKKCNKVVYTDQLKLIDLDQRANNLGIFFDDDLVEEIEEYYMYTLIPFMCDVGGNLGLFLGLSFPAIYELVGSAVVYFFKMR